jgi:hypothetical protein
LLAGRKSTAGLSKSDSVMPIFLPPLPSALHHGGDQGEFAC